MARDALQGGALDFLGLDSLPPGWQFDLLGNRCTIRRGSSPRPAGDPKYFGNGTIPWIKIGDATRAPGRYIESTDEYVNEEGAACSVRIPAGSLIIANSGVSLGFAAITRVEGCIHDGWLLPTDFKELDRDYLYYCISLITDRIRTFADGTTQPNLNTDIARRLLLPMPPLTEQLSIARALGALDDKIELNRRMSGTLESMARALFRSWFVDFDPVRAKAEGRLNGLPVDFSDLLPNSFEESELGEIPAGWKVVGLDEIGRFLNGLALQKYPPTNDQSLPVVKIAQLRSGHTEGADRASADLEGDYVVEDGDILFSWSGSLECVLWAGGRGALNQHLFKVTSEKSPKWLLYLAIHRHLEGFRRIAAGKATTMGHIQRHHLSSAKLALPPDSVLCEMDGFFSPILDRIVNCGVSSQLLARTRDTLLPKLISGTLRASHSRPEA